MQRPCAEKAPGSWSKSPLHPLLGAEVRGVNLADVGRQEILSVLAPALEKYGVLLFRGQDILPNSSSTSSRRFRMRIWMKSMLPRTPLPKGILPACQSFLVFGPREMRSQTRRRTAARRLSRTRRAWSGTRTAVASHYSMLRRSQQDR